MRTQSSYLFCENRQTGQMGEAGNQMEGQGERWTVVPAWHFQGLYITAEWPRWRINLCFTVEGWYFNTDLKIIDCQWKEWITSDASYPSLLHLSAYSVLVLELLFVMKNILFPCKKIHDTDLDREIWSLRFELMQSVLPHTGEFLRIHGSV